VFQQPPAAKIRPPKEVPPTRTPPPLQTPPAAIRKLPAPVDKTPGPTGPATVSPKLQPGPPGPRAPVAVKRFDEVKKGRVERIEDGRKVIQEGNRVIIKQDNRVIIRHDEAERFRRRPDARTERRPDGNVETFYVRRDGVRIITEVDAHGRLLRRYRRTPDGRERNLIDNRRFYSRLAVGVGIGLGIGIALNLPPPRIIIPRERYIVDYDSASDDDLFEALDAPPIEDLDRAYSLEEIRDNYELRARLRSIDIESIHFDFGSWEVPRDQYWKLERIARAILRLLRSNPDAVIMVAGYTDAVGSDEDNASLSDRRAAAVADVLTEEFGVPEENLVTQGYGEQYLKIDTPGPEPRNRRVQILNLTGLMAER
jgi:outer membrane protein OmpA-like peptidoglycan-associated protein